MTDSRSEGEKSQIVVQCSVSVGILTNNEKPNNTYPTKPNSDNNNKNVLIFINMSDSRFFDFRIYLILRVELNLSYVAGEREREREQTTQIELAKLVT